MSDEAKKWSQAKGASRTLIPVTLFTFVVLTTQYLPAQQPSPTPIALATLVEAMDARQKAADSVMLRWTDTQTWGEPGLNELTSPAAMLLKGASMRYESQVLSFAGAGASLVERVSSFDGNESRLRVGGKQPSGRLDTEIDAICAANLPLLLFFRPLAEPYHTLNRKNLKLLDKRKAIDGHECVTIDDGHLRVYLNCDRDFVPVAFSGYLQGDPYMSGSIEYYRAQGAIRWVPKAFQVEVHAKRWVVRFRGDGVQTTIGVPLKKSDFALNFGPGTVVWDARTGEQHRIRSDGSKESIKPPEQHNSREPLNDKARP